MKTKVKRVTRYNGQYMFPVNATKKCLVCEAKINLSTDGWVPAYLEDTEILDGYLDFQIICLNKKCEEAYKLLELLGGDYD